MDIRGAVNEEYPELAAFADPYHRSVIDACGRRMSSGERWRGPSAPLTSAVEGVTSLGTHLGVLSGWANSIAQAGRLRLSLQGAARVAGGEAGQESAGDGHDGGTDERGRVPVG